MLVWALAGSIKTAKPCAKTGTVLSPTFRVHCKAKERTINGEGGIRFPGRPRTAVTCVFDTFIMHL